MQYRFQPVPLGMISHLPAAGLLTSKVNSKWVFQAKRETEVNALLQGTQRWMFI